LQDKITLFDKLGYSMETAIVCGLLHDLAKVNTYKEGGDPAQGRQLSWALELLGHKARYMEVEEQLKLISMGYIKFSGNPGESQTLHVTDSLPKEHASDIIGWLKDGYRPGTMPEMKLSYSVDEQLPLGHGEKSGFLAQKFIDLTDEEALAIRWHMTAFDPSIHFDYPNGYAFRKAAEMSPLVTLLFTADYEASNIIERKA
jgi:hypothetical protein